MIVRSNSDAVQKIDQKADRLAAAALVRAD
jgi:hypothetical protein